MSEEQEIARARARVGLRADFREVFNNPRGQRVLRKLMAEAFISRPSLSTDPSFLLVKEGMQRIVLSIMRQCLGPEDKVAQLIIEASQLELENQDHA